MRVACLTLSTLLLAACAVDEPPEPDHDATLNESDDAPDVAETMSREDLLALMEPTCEAAQASEVAQAVCAVTCSTALALGCGAVLVACHGAVAFSAGGALIPCGLAVKVACGGVLCKSDGCTAIFDMRPTAPGGGVYGGSSCLSMADMMRLAGLPVDQ